LNDGMSPDEARIQFGWPVEVLLVESQKAGVAKNDRGIAFLNIGAMLQTMEQWRLAGTVLQAAMNELPSKQAALAAREAAQVLAHENEEAQAFELLRKAVALDPDNPDTRMVYARTLLKQGKNLEAREEYNRLLQMPGLSEKAREVITQEMHALP
ncbi:MAG TPA: tetratricopeptide repeat protein, partial [Candidatus Hydrogenedentes bacterium]|nr:tetratricopeptide repeat protein [Candidatus Hydrogenedentota bacterium]